MYPELFKIGNFPVYSYGVWLAAALVLGLVIAARLGKRDGLPSERIYDLGLWVLIAGLLGSKLLMIFVDESYRQNPWQLLSMDFLRSGGVYYGGFIGGLLATALLIRRYKLNFWKVSDAFAPALALGQAFGRQGCFSAGCCWGKESNMPWAVHFTEQAHEFTGVPIYDANGENLFLHPTQMYESIAMLFVFGFLIYLHRWKRFDGQVLLGYMMIYPLTRFIIEFFRDDPRGSLIGVNEFIGLSTSQTISLAVGLLAFVLLAWRLRKTNPNNSL